MRRNSAPSFSLAHDVLCALAVGIVLGWATSASAQLDSDPLNNAQATGDVLPLAGPGTAIFNRAALAAGGNDVDFFGATLVEGDVLFGMTVPIANLPAGFDIPDTMMAVFDGPTRRTFSDDDDANDPTPASIRGSLFRFRADRAGVHHIGVTGYDDIEFDGAASGNPHPETGAYWLTVGRVNPAVSGGGFSDTDPANQTTAGADLIVIPPATHAAVAVSRLGANDVDFYRLDLRAGDVLSAITAPLANLAAGYSAPDTMLGLFNAGGSLLLLDDDSGNGGAPGSDYPLGDIFASALRAEITTSGTYYLAVTGFGDDSFLGAHAESGPYGLLVGVPEPSSIVLAAGALAAVAVVVRRKRKR